MKRPGCNLQSKASHCFHELSQLNECYEHKMLLSHKLCVKVSQPVIANNLQLFQIWPLSKKFYSLKIELKLNNVPAYKKLSKTNTNGKHLNDFWVNNAKLSGGIFHEYFSHKNVSFWREKSNLLLRSLDTEELRTLAMVLVPYLDILIGAIKHEGTQSTLLLMTRGNVEWWKPFRDFNENFLSVSCMVRRAGKEPSQSLKL